MAELIRINALLPGGAQSLGAMLDDGPECNTLLLLAHGAGAGMTHGFMEALSARLLAQHVATLRFNFPYVENGRRMPDRAEVLEAAIEGALGEASRRSAGRPLFCGGKSMGGRLTSMFLAKQQTPDPVGIVFFGFPLHPPKRPSIKRAQHLCSLEMPSLFLQGTRDALADLNLLRPVVGEMGDRATLHVVEGADHGFKVLKRSGRSHQDVLEELAEETRRWMTDALVAVRNRSTGC